MTIEQKAMDSDLKSLSVQDLNKLADFLKEERERLARSLFTRQHSNDGEPAPRFRVVNASK